MPLNLDYFYGGESEQYSFYRIPKVLFTAAHYRAVPVEAKVLYGLLLDRMALSARNGWLDEGRRVFIYFTLEDAMAMMGCGHNKAVRLFADLEQIGLIERRKQGQGRPTRIYVKNFILPTETGEPEEESDTPQLPAVGQTSEYGKSEAAPEVLTSQNRKSALPETGSPDFPKANANKTDKNKTEQSDTDLSIPPSSPRDSPREQRQRMRMDEMDSYRELVKEATTDSQGEAVVGRYLVIVTDTDTTDPVANATVTLHGDDTISIRLPNSRLLDYDDQTTVSYMNRCCWGKSTQRSTKQKNPG